MKLLHILLILFLPAAVWAQCDDLKPMFGDDCNKTAAQRKVDTKFIKGESKTFGTADSAANAYVAMGWMHFYRHNPEAAMKHFNQAWLLNPANPAVYFGFGHMTRYAFKKDAAEAEKYYKLGRERDLKHTEEPMSLVVLLNVSEARKELNTVIDISTQLIQGFPDFGKGFGYKKRSYYYIQAQLFQNALEDSNKAIAIDPEDPNNYAIRGFAHFWLHENEKSLEDYNRAITIAPNAEQAYHNRAILYLERLEQPEPALADIEKAIALEEKEPQHQKVKSDILFRMNRKEEACKCLKNAIELGSTNLVEDYQQKCASKLAADR